MNVGIYIYDDAEVLDFSGPYEVFLTATRVAKENQPYNVFLVSETGQTVTARAGYRVIPDFSFDNCPAIDLLIVVGGVHTAELKKTSVLKWVKKKAGEASLVASVCTGAFILAEAGVITDQKVTTHWEDIPDLRQQYPELEVIENKRWVDTGAIITSGGISAGIDMSLYLVSRTQSNDLAVITARQMEFDWTHN